MMSAKHVIGDSQSYQDEVAKYKRRLELVGGIDMLEFDPVTVAVETAVAATMHAYDCKTAVENVHMLLPVEGHSSTPMQTGIAIGMALMLMAQRDA